MKKISLVIIGALVIGGIGYFVGTQSEKPGELVLDKLLSDPTFQQKLAEHDFAPQSEPYTDVNWHPNAIGNSVTDLKCITQNSSYGFGLVTDLTKIRNPIKAPDNLFGETSIQNLKTNPVLQYVEGGAVWDFTDIGSNNPNIKNYFHKGQNSYVLMTIYKPTGIMSLTFHEEITGSMGDKDFTVDSAIYSCRPA
jgi:hypothetical protein